jgi:hypothetical protein
MAPPPALSAPNGTSMQRFHKALGNGFLFCSWVYPSPRWCRRTLYDLNSSPTPWLLIRRLLLISSNKVRHKFCPSPHPLSFSCQCAYSLLRQARAASLSGSIIFPISLWLETVPLQLGYFKLVRSSLVIWKEHWPRRKESPVLAISTSSQVSEQGQLPFFAWSSVSSSTE